MEKLDAVMLDLERGVNLDPIYREHQLYGSYKGFLECHIEPDWLLVYFIDLSAGDIYFARTGTHADLF